MPILKLDKDDPKRELEFEVEYQLSIPPEERLIKWLRWNIEMLQFIRQRKNESRKSHKIIKRS